MKYILENKNFNQIKEICERYYISNYTINSDGTVDVYENVILSNCGLTSLPLKFGYISGHFSCAYNNLKTLEGAPREVGSFLCSHNRLTSLEGAPRKVGGYFDCDNNQLTSLVGAPEDVGGDFHCNWNELTSLQGAPSKVGGSFNCYTNKLTSLAGAPEEIGGGFYCSANPLPKEIFTNYKYINKIVKYQNDYNIWRRDGSLDKYRFSDMMKEIMEEE